MPVPSSFTLAAGCVSYNNLSSIEWLFSGSGDHQFDVYRMMREETRYVSSTWGHCKPPTEGGVGGHRGHYKPPTEGGVGGHRGHCRPPTRGGMKNVLMTRRVKVQINM